MTLNFPWPWICLFTGTAIVIFGIRLRKKLAQSKAWPKTIGIVAETSIQPRWSRIGGDRIYVVKPKVIYKYHAGGVAYTSSQLALVEMNTADADLAREKAEKYKVGQNIEVYYDPQKPGFATLQVGDPTGGKLPLSMIIFGLSLIMAGMILFFRVH